MTDKTKLLILSLHQTVVSIHKESRDVFLRLDLAETSAALMPGYEFAIGMSPTEARQLAQVLIRKANEAEEGLPRA